VVRDSHNVLNNWNGELFDMLPALKDGEHVNSLIGRPSAGAVAA